MMGTHPCRQKIAQLADVKGSHLLFRNGWVHSAQEEIDEYRSVLARSRFSLCPRGTAPQSIRFWESLQAGAIPVLISDSLCLPENANWDEMIVRVPEDAIATIPERLAAISPEREEAMRQACLDYFATYVEGDNFVATIREFYR
jgi:hypothetical protein